MADITQSGDPAAILALIQNCFAYMDSVIDPPSSMYRLTADAIAQHPGEVWSMGTPPYACVSLTPKTGVLYVGKLAVSTSHRGQGIARRLIDHAESRAKVLGLPCLALETRIELTANQATFVALGFIEVARTAHPGYDRPTGITYHRPVRGSA